MIIVSAYPDLHGPIETGTLLKQLRQAVDKLLPSKVILHILPPYPASGDCGFAADDWFSIRTDLGFWHDIADWALSRKIILDGIYNHVGFKHPWVTEFLSRPSEDGPIYAYQVLAPPSSQLSPRGGSVFRKHTIDGDSWYVWQTFSERSFDIRLLSPQVQDEIRRHLCFLSESGIYGVRLDGCAYYGHDLAVEQFHNPSACRISQFLANEANKFGLFVLAQLDADPCGASYFMKKEGWSVPVVDYAYSAVLVLTLLSESASKIETHIKRTNDLPCEFIRPPRTHDGILLQSDLLTDDELDELQRICEEWDLPVRIVDGESYEINSSLPFICSLGVNKKETWQRILLVIALTGFLPGIPYFYLPFILCDIPEARSIELDNDPRSLNRARLLISHIAKFTKSIRRGQLHTLLRNIDRARTLYPDNGSTTVLSSDNADSVLVLTRDGDSCLFACNFSTRQDAMLKLSKKMKLIWGNRASNRTLGPLGFGFWRNLDKSE